ncbi:MAG TPA: 4'-phosphopantetheinyl transferase superfamily protein [Verrucomicrobiae bacterium]
MHAIDIPNDEVHVWVESLAPDTARLKRAVEVLSEEERERARRFLREVDRVRYVMAHLKTREILAGYMGCEPAALKFVRGEFGKPELAKELNARKVSFNISHSGERLLLGIVREARIGVDIEEIRPESATLDIAARFFTADENRHLRSLSGTKQVEGFFNCWTRKEAYLKALGCGLSVSPTDCEVTLLPDDEPKLVRRASCDIAKEWQMFHRGEGNYIIAIAVDRSGLSLKQKSG